MFLLLFENSILFDSSVFLEALYIPVNSFIQRCPCCGHFQALGWSVPLKDDTSNECECHLVLSTSPPPRLSSAPKYTPCLVPSPHLASCPCLLWWCEAPPRSGSSSQSSGKTSPKFVKTHIGCLIFSLTSLRQENCRIDPLAWHLDVKPKGGQ